MNSHSYNDTELLGWNVTCFISSMHACMHHLALSWSATLFICACISSLPRASPIEHRALLAAIAPSTVISSWQTSSAYG